MVAGANAGPLGVFVEDSRYRRSWDYLTPGGSATLQGILLRPPLLSTKALGDKLGEAVAVETSGSGVNERRGPHGHRRQ